eukprot:scaffold88353_cov21-Tisochrysis_lutea.AAC.1
MASPLCWVPNKKASLVEQELQLLADAANGNAINGSNKLGAQMLWSNGNAINGSTSGNANRSSKLGAQLLWRLHQE